MYKLFVAEDDAGIANAVAELGRAWGFEVKLCEDFSDVTAEFAAFSPHIVLMDIGLPFLRRLSLVQKNPRNIQGAHNIHFRRRRQHEYYHGRQHGGRRFCHKAL